jgi:phospholipid/cholesterol/gamma-HCH transport system substrate-binding protein
MTRTVRLGAFILGALIIFAVAIFLVGEKQFLFSRTYRLNAPFDNVAGLDQGAPVRAGGVRVGTVDHIRMPSQAGEKLVVAMDLESSTRGVIKRDSVAAIGTEGLLGNKYVAISFGAKESESIRDGDTIQSKPPLDYADLVKKADEIMDSTKIAVNNVNAATDDLKSITAKVNQGEGTIGALINDRQVYRDLNATTASARQTVAEAQTGVVSFQENMEALKHNWFLRGFFRKRGYYDSSQLTAHAIAKLPDRPATKKFAFNATDLFGKPDTAKLKGEKLLNPVGEFLEQTPFGQAVVVAHAGLKGEKDKNLTLTQAQAMVVRQSLAGRYRINDARLKTLGLGEDEQAGRVEIIVYGAAENHLAGANNSTLVKR